MSIRAAVAFSEDIDDPYRAGGEIAAQINAKLKLGPRSIGILFAAIEFEPEPLLRGVRERLPIPIVGCTTASEVSNGGYFEESASLLVLTGEGFAVGTGLGEGISRDPQAAVKAACDAASTMLGRQAPKLALTFPDCALTLSADNVLRLLVDRLGPSLPVVGGVPGDGLRFKGARQFFNDRVITDAVPVVLVGGAVRALVVTRSGWIPMGRRARATKVSGNILHEIDHRPALEYFTRYTAVPQDPSITGSSLSVAVLDQSIEGDDGRHFIIRAPFVFDKETGAVTYNGDIPPNAEIQLARGSQDDILEGVRDAARVLRRKAGDAPLDALLCFSCAGRKLLLGLETKREIEIILRELGGDEAAPPVNGFYSYGEIGPVDTTNDRLSASRFHNTTVVLCALTSLPLTEADDVAPASARSDVASENQRLKRENGRLTRDLRRLERRLEAMDKMARANDTVNQNL
jgi:hypothetical protein